ncbi:MAG: hypothetical protein IJC98_03730 [Clostridia bacterium]|nr:hypothetical protein [Clostridia bacterium]
MYLKIIGAALILLACLRIGTVLILQERQRVVQLRAFFVLITAIREGIGVLHLPLREICTQHRDPNLVKTGYTEALMRRFSSEEDTGMPVLANAFFDISESLSLTEGEVQLLSAFFLDIGTQDSEKECSRCDYYKAKLSGLLETAVEGLPARIKVLRTVSLSVGGLLVLMLL